MPWQSTHTKQYTTLPQVLVVGDTDALDIYACDTWNAMYEATVVANIDAATQELVRRRYDAVLSKISPHCDEGMALPSRLLDLKARGSLAHMPAVLWHGAHDVSLLESHARVARNAGLVVEMLAASDTGTSVNLQPVLALIKMNQRSDLSVNSPLPSEQDLVRALVADDEVSVVLQPQIDLRSGRIVGAEALARWRHPDYGNIPPSIFVPMAHKTGLGLLLFHLIEAKVVAFLGELYQRDRAVPISVNASSETLCTEGLADRLERRLRDAGVPNALLKIELTEDVPVDDMLALSTALSQLRMRGFPVVVDDFGCGIASMDLLTQLPFSELKIDGRFVQGMEEDSGCDAAVAASISLGRALNLDVVAEGIESDVQANHLLRQGCHIGQGAALSPPLTMEDFVYRLSASGTGAPPVCRH